LQATATFDEIAPLLPVIPAESLHELPAYVDRMLAERDRLIGEYEHFRREVALQQSLIRNYGQGASSALDVRVPLRDMLAAGHGDLLQQFDGALRGMEAGHQALQQSQLVQAAIKDDCDAIEAKRRKQRNLGWCLAVLIVGIFLLRAAAEMQSDVDQKKRELEDELGRAEGFGRELEAQRAVAQEAHAKLCALAEELLQERLARLESAWTAKWSALPPMLRGDWGESAWNGYDFSRGGPLPFLTVAIRDVGNDGARLQVPCFAPFIGQETTLLIEGGDEASLRLMQALIMQAATLLPHAVAFTLLDPAGAGRAFPMQRDLPFVRRSGGDLARNLDEVLAEVTRIIHTHIGGGTKSFEKLPDTIRSNERFEVIVAANFPDSYDRRTIETLQKIARNGPLAGKYVILHGSNGTKLPSDLSWDGFGKIWRSSEQGITGNPGNKRVDVFPLSGPDGGELSKILALLSAAEPPESMIRWSDLNDCDSSHWWSESAEKSVEAPVGVSGMDRQLRIWFGANSEGQACTHGMVAGTNGSGKSVLYHVLICSLATRYSPQELDFYLVDLKEGTEFQFYRGLPHARVLALNSDPDFSRSVLRELCGEFMRRSNLFTSYGVTNLAEYRAAGSPGGPMPRSLLLIDEYHRLFENDPRGEASELLSQLAKQGRSAGLHFLLGSQRFSAAGMLHQADIFANVHLRVALKMMLEDVQTLTEFGRAGRGLIGQCDRSGKAVINDQGGSDSANQFGKVVFLDHKKGEVQELVTRIAEKAEREIPLEQRIATIVFDGKAQPNLCENPQLRRILRQEKRPTASEWKNLVAVPIHEKGLGVLDWYAGERPLALWLGQKQDMHGQAAVILRRRLGEHILLMGDNQMAICGMMAAMLVSACVFEAPGAIRFQVLDRTLPGTQWADMLHRTIEAVPAALGYDIDRTADPAVVPGWLDEWSAELERRLNLPEAELANQATWIMLLAGGDRIPSLARAANSYGSLIDSPATTLFKSLLGQGPVLGLHVVMAFPSAVALRQVCEPGLFRHRIGTQMSEADSFVVFSRDLAAKLQPKDRPVFALCHDTTIGHHIKFKPYMVDSEIPGDKQIRQIPWDEQFSRIMRHLKRWKSNN
jgi:S-DNA-T family DNA segregation ATPase FtsK/SpoIIIE